MPDEIAKDAAFAPDRLSVPDQVAGATVIGQMTVPAATGALKVDVTGQVMVVDAELLITIVIDNVAASALEISPIRAIAAMAVYFILILLLMNRSVESRPPPYLRHLTLRWADAGNGDGVEPF